MSLHWVSGQGWIHKGTSSLTTARGSCIQRSLMAQRCGCGVYMPTGSATEHGTARRLCNTGKKVAGRSWVLGDSGWAQLTVLCPWGLMAKPPIYKLVTATSPIKPPWSTSTSPTPGASSTNPSGATTRPPGRHPQGGKREASSEDHGGWVMGRGRTITSSSLRARTALFFIVANLAIELPWARTFRSAV